MRACNPGRLAGAITTLVAASLALLATAGTARAQEGETRRPLSLEQAIGEALEGNADLAVAEARTRMAGAGARAASAPLWPSVQLATGWTRSNDPVFAFGTKLRQGIFAQSDLALDALNSPDPITDWSSGATAQWKLLSAPAWAGRSAANRQADAAEWAETRTREGTVLRTEALYYEAQRAAAQARAARRAEDAAHSARDVFARRVEQGMLTQAELLQAEADWQFAVAGRIDAERLETDALRRLAVHLGWEPDVLPELSDSLTVEDAAVAADSTPERSGRAGLPEDLSDRADLLALHDARDAASADATRARLGWLPELEAFGAWSMHGSDAFASDGDNWTAGLALRWTLFSGFSRSADIQRADAARAEAEARYDEALRAARAEAAEAEAAVVAARRAAGAALIADSAAATGRDLMRRRFEEGLATATDLLAAESRAARARSGAIDALANYRLAEARLRFVVTQHPSE